MQISIKTDFSKFADKMRQMGASLADHQDIVGTIYNDVNYIWALEYGSHLGKRPWPNPGPKTEFGIDPLEGKIKVVSTQGFAMLRGNEEKAEKVLSQELAQIKLEEDLRPQLVNAINSAAAFWLRAAVIGTPVDTGRARRAWGITPAK